VAAEVPVGIEEEFTLSVSVAAVPVPVIDMDWLDPATPRLLSVVINVPVIEPALRGKKLSISVQDDPAASKPVADEEGVNCGQVELELRLKLVETLGFVPVVGMEKTSGAFPLLVMLTVCGLPLLVPTVVEAKLRVGGLCALNSRTVLLTKLLTYRFPPLSTAMPSGFPSPVAIVVIVGVAEITPPAATIIFNVLCPESVK
jgi:hypothetical protein